MSLHRDAAQAAMRLAGGALKSAAAWHPGVVWIFERAAASLFGLGALLVCGAGLLSVGLGPDNNWDLRYYHLYAPYAYLHGRYLHDLGPAQSQGFLNPVADFLFYSLISSPLNELPRVIAFIMGALHGINIALILLIAIHVLRPADRETRLLLRAAAVLIGASGAGFISLVGVTTNDLLYSIFILASLLVLLKIAEATDAPKAWIAFACAGLLAGLGSGMKFTAIIFVPGLTLIALITAFERKTIAGVIAFGVAVLAGFFMAAGHHMLTLWEAFGSPVFPWLNQVFQSPYYDPVALRDTRFLPRDLWQAIAYPFYWTKIDTYVVAELPFRDWRGAIAYLAVIAGVFAFLKRLLSGRRSSAEHPRETRGFRLLCIFTAVSFFAWEFCFGIYRYGVLLEMLSGILIMGALLWLTGNRNLRAGIALALLIVLAATTVHLDWGRGEFGNRYVDVRVPQLPANSVVLIATTDPVAYFIPFAEPTAQYVGIENNYLKIAQNNGLANAVKRLMQTPGRAKFVLSVGESDEDRLSSLLSQFDLKLDGSPCAPIWSNLQVHTLSLCRITADETSH
jgi:hypothetical protein